MRQGRVYTSRRRKGGLKSLGMIALALAFLGILWRVYNGRPPLVASIKPWELIAAKTAHALLYALTLFIPITGYFVSTSQGSAVSVFGWFSVAPLVAVGEGFREVALALHYYFAYGAGCLVVVHAAAFKHQLVDKDDTLGRMLW